MAGKFALELRILNQQTGYSYNLYFPSNSRFPFPACLLVILTPRFLLFSLKPRQACCLSRPECSRRYGSYRSVLVVTHPLHLFGYSSFYFWFFVFFCVGLLSDLNQPCPASFSASTCLRSEQLQKHVLPPLCVELFPSLPSEDS